MPLIRKALLALVLLLPALAAHAQASGDVFTHSIPFRILLAVLIVALLRMYVYYRNREHKTKRGEDAIAYFANSQYTNNNPEEILWDMARNCISRLGFVDCVIYLIDSKRNVLLQKAALGDKGTDDELILNPIEIPLGRGIVGSVAASGISEIVSDTSKDSRYIADDASRLSELTVPILYEGATIGVIDSEHPSKNFFTRQHKALLETIASICATKIVKAQAVQSLVEKEKKFLEQQKEAAEMQLKALRAQMNPHFIFNALNSIQRYILQSDVDRAETYLDKFAKLMRLILDNSRNNEVLLSQELELLGLYLELEKMRFGNKFDFEIVIEEEVEPESLLIPAMIIQPYAENAVLHGLHHKESGGMLCIRLYLEDDLLKCIVADNGIGRAKSGLLARQLTTPHHSAAQQISEERMKVIRETSGAPAAIELVDLYEGEEPAGTRVEITLPVMTKQREMSA